MEVKKGLPDRNGLKAGYKQTEIGVIPEDWEVSPLSVLTTLMTNGFVGTAKIHYTESDEGILYIQGYNVEENDFNFNGIKRVSPEFHKKQSKSCLRKDDLLTVQTGDVGLTTIVPKELEGSNCHALIITRFKKERLNSKFFAYYLNSAQGRARLKEIETGTTMKHINVGDMIHFLVPIPPTKAEQTAIATALSDADALIQSLEKLIAKKHLIKQGAMQELLKPKKGWVVKKLGEVFTFHGGYTASREQLSFDGYCYLHYGDIHGATKTFINVKNDYAKIPKLQIPLKKVSPKSLLNEGDIVFVDASEDDEGTSRHIVVKNPDGVPYISGLHTIVAKSKDDSVNNDYKRYCFQSAYIKNQFKFYAVGTKVSGISKTNILKIEISLPTLDEQTSIAIILSDMDAEIFALETKLAKYKQVKQGMMQNLLTGKIRLV